MGMTDAPAVAFRLLPAGPLGVRLSLLLIVFSVISGCAVAPSARFRDSSQLLRRLSEQTSCSRAVSGDAQLSVAGPFVNVRGNLLYRVEAPDRLRLDLYSPLGVTLSTLTSDGGKFSLYDLASRSFYWGAPKTCNLAKFTHVNVAPLALVELLRGRVPLLVHSPDAIRMRYARPIFSKGRYVVHVDGEDGFQQVIHVAVNPRDLDRPLLEQRLQLRSVRIEREGSLVYEVKLSAFQPARSAPLELSPEEIEMGLTLQPPSGPSCSAELPGEVRFSVGRRGYHLIVRNQSVHHNPQQSEGAFTQEVPSGVRVIHSDCR
jgi:hypothetical protein